MGIYSQNLEHGYDSHNRGYAQSKATNLNSNHRFNHNHNQEREHD